jgi:DNA polymerase I
MSLLVVDGTALLLRAWFAGADALSVSRTFLRRSEAPRRAVVFDAGMVTFRTHLDPRYKADRPHPGEELIDLYNRFEESCEELGWAAFKKPGFEADDLAATLIGESRRRGVQATMVSNDKDLLQLVADDEPAVTVFDRPQQKTYDEAAVVEKMGVLPVQIRDLMALTGDSSDGVVGVAGIGPKTAVALIQAFGDLEGIYADLRQVEAMDLRGAAGVAKKLEVGLSEAFLARELVTLKDDVDLGEDAWSRTC